MSATCFDCRHAAIREWASFTANCPGCMDRALAGLKTLPPIEPAEGEPAKQPKIFVKVTYGTAESDERYVEREGWLQHQSRRVFRNEAGKVTERSGWADCGGRMRFPPSMQPARWWEFWK